MSDNAELIAKLRDVGTVHEALSYSSEAEPFRMMREAADAIERAERDAAHWHRLYIEECGKGDVELENAQRDLRAAAASEAAMREAIHRTYDIIVGNYALDIPYALTHFGDANVALSEVTPQMLEAGLRAADLLSYRWGWGEEEVLITRVYLAMLRAALRRFPAQPTPSKSEP